MSEMLPGGAARRPHRRVQRPGAPGADPTPQLGVDAVLRARGDVEPPSPAEQHAHDEQLLRDVPPHWRRTS